MSYFVPDAVDMEEVEEELTPLVAPIMGEPLGAIQVTSGRG